ncbi:hypothetical protein OH76DRAFT_1406840 [Lentinus brumalis]|uniref:Uncharacterized protein n=1 Tax=Lentinus brumalis TaxID=2498619 RepID=A0A371D1Y1_9APHY|nr:hypothetical protein OH76DRAFT_1406840 [Polyporus brumalis]
MNNQNFNFQFHRIPEQDQTQEIQLDYGPPDSSVATPVSQLKAVRIQQPLASVAEGDEDPSDDVESTFNLTPPSSQDSTFSVSQESSSTISGHVGAPETHLVTASAPTQPAQTFRPVTRTRTLRKEDTLMAVDAPSITDEVEMRLLPVFQSMCAKMCNEICNRQTQTAAEIHAAIRQSYLQTQREVLALKQEVNDLRLQLAEQRRVY